MGTQWNGYFYPKKLQNARQESITSYYDTLEHVPEGSREAVAFGIGSANIMSRKLGG